MEDVVAVIVRSQDRGETAVLSWGRLFDPVDPTELLTALKRVLPKMGYGRIDELVLCDDLGQASDFEYFYEGVMRFTQQMALHNVGTKRFRKAHRPAKAFRKTLYILGSRRP